MPRQTLSAAEAARALGISVDTLRRWDRDGKIRVERDAANRRVVPVGEVERLRGPAASETLSARNRFRGIVTKVVKDKVMAQVEMQAGPFRVVSLMSREAADELDLEPGTVAVAAVKSTHVVVELPGPR